MIIGDTLSKVMIKMSPKMLVENQNYVLLRCETAKNGPKTFLRVHCEFFVFGFQTDN